MRHTLYYLRSSDVIHEETPSQVLSEYYHMRDPLHRRASVTGPPGSETHVQPLARKTIQVAGGSLVVCLLDLRMSAKEARPCCVW